MEFCSMGRHMKYRSGGRRTHTPAGGLQMFSPEYKRTNWFQTKVLHNLWRGEVSALLTTYLMCTLVFFLLEKLYRENGIYLTQAMI